MSSAQLSSARTESNRIESAWLGLRDASSFDAFLGWLRVSIDLSIACCLEQIRHALLLLPLFPGQYLLVFHFRLHSVFARVEILLRMLVHDSHLSGEIQLDAVGKWKQQQQQQQEQKNRGRESKRERDIYEKWMDGK